MSRQRPDKWPTLAEAAKVEGITVEALRKRITRGQVDAQKVGGRWYVNPDSLTGHDRTEADNVSGQGRTSAQVDGATLREVIEAQRAHIETLTRELDLRNAELYSMHLQAERLTDALPAPKDDNASGKDESGQPRARWWQRRPRK